VGVLIVWRVEKEVKMRVESEGTWTAGGKMFEFVVGCHGLFPQKLDVGRELSDDTGLSFVV
jgi:hypothetical protein